MGVQGRIGLVVALLVAAIFGGCASDHGADQGGWALPDANGFDAGSTDGSAADGYVGDAGTRNAVDSSTQQQVQDAHTSVADAGESEADTPGTDASGTDASGTDAGGTDADGTDAGGTDADGTDAGGTDAGGTDAGGADTTESDAGAVYDPKFPHFNAVIDAARGSAPTWASFIHGVKAPAGWKFREVGYKDSGHKLDFWPASVIKIYPVVAALILVKQAGVSLDAKATFYRRKGKGAWIKDTTRTVRQMIHGTFNCSSNSDYTLLLRLAGVDWINTKLLVAAKGFAESALMVGYVTSRPWVYYRSEQQRIVLTDGGKTHERVHSWSGVMHSKKVKCGVSYSSVGAANCSSTHDMAEHVRRIHWHESLPAADRFDVRKADLDWLRFGDKKAKTMSNKNCSAVWAGVKKVFPGAHYLHKGGKISTYALTAHGVFDKASGVHYTTSISTKSATKTAVIRLSETVARMAQNPAAFLYLNNLKDHVNPVKAKLLVYSDKPAVLDLVTKDAKLSATDPKGWTPLPGSSLTVKPGTVWHTLTSACLAKSGKVHIKGRLRANGKVVAYSDLHFVIVDAKVACP